MDAAAAAAGVAVPAAVHVEGTAPSACGLKQHREQMQRMADSVIAGCEHHEAL